jgi:tRNA threonylcarbamoyladenosine biosynthesis protein TsaB
LALLLYIDTSSEIANVYLAENDTLLFVEENKEQKNHASFIQPAIQKIIKQANISLLSIQAIVVVNGPGSYTGLRVGLSTAKGLCYALNKPLILLNTLDIMALELQLNQHQLLPIQANSLPVLFCPMIDARRMEVFTALYDEQLNYLIEPSALILNENCFEQELNQKIIIFCGSGSIKFKQLISHSNAVFTNNHYKPITIIEAGNQKFMQSNFSDLAYCEPFYIKDFYTTASTQNIVNG